MMTREKMKQIRDHLAATGQAFCFVNGEIIDLAECSRYLYGEVIRVVGTSKVYCNSKAHVQINHTGSWKVVDRYLKIEHANCVPLQFQKIRSKNDENRNEKM